MTSNLERAVASGSYAALNAPLLHLPQSWSLSRQQGRGLVETSGHWRISLGPGAGSYPELRVDPGATRFRWNEAEGRYHRVKLPPVAVIPEIIRVLAKSSINLILRWQIPF
jgi:hypothetical protein